MYAGMNILVHTFYTLIGLFHWNKFLDLELLGQRDAYFKFYAFCHTPLRKNHTDFQLDQLWIKEALLFLICILNVYFEVRAVEIGRRQVREAYKTWKGDCRVICFFAVWIVILILMFSTFTQGNLASRASEDGCCSTSYVNL